MANVNMNHEADKVLEESRRGKMKTCLGDRSGEQTRECSSKETMRFTVRSKPLSLFLCFPLPKKE